MVSRVVFTTTAPAPGPSHVYKGSSPRRRPAFTSPLDRLQPKVSFLRSVLLPRSSWAHRGPRLRARVFDICWNRAVLIPVPNPPARINGDFVIPPSRPFAFFLAACVPPRSTPPRSTPLLLRESTYGWYCRYVSLVFQVLIHAFRPSCAKLRFDKAGRSRDIA